MTGLVWCYLGRSEGVDNVISHHLQASALKTVKVRFLVASGWSAVALQVGYGSRHPSPIDEIHIVFQDDSEKCLLLSTAVVFVQIYTFPCRHAFTTWETVSELLLLGSGVNCISDQETSHWSKHPKLIP